MFLMSIKPMYAKQIFEKTKKFEFRKKIPNIQYNTRIIVYASGRIQAIIGEFRVGDIYFLKIPELWSLAQKGGGISKDYFMHYFRGYKYGYAIEILSPIAYPKKLSLREIREYIPNFNPPINFIRIKGKLKRVIKEFLNSTLSERYH